MTDDTKPTGRPKGSATGQTPMRTLRMGPLWEQGQAAAKAHGMTMTALVEEALREKLAKLDRQDRRAPVDVTETAVRGISAAEALAATLPPAKPSMPPNEDVEWITG